MLAIAYVSTAVHVPPRRALELVLTDARDFNARIGVTGALLLHDRTFFQYFEGPEAAADEVYGRIKRARLHRDIVELFHEPVDERFFEAWHMGFAEAPCGVLLSIAHADWRRNVPHKVGDSVPEGIGLLLNFWNRSQRRHP